MAKRRFLELTKKVATNVVQAPVRKRTVDVDEVVLIEEAENQYGCELTLRSGKQIHVEESYATVIASLQRFG